ncbi:hypothetical protein U1Q18_051858 [Sarracenia purpurea var. burkii]
MLITYQAQRNFVKLMLLARNHRNAKIAPQELSVLSEKMDATPSAAVATVDAKLDIVAKSARLQKTTGKKGYSYE